MKTLINSLLLLLLFMAYSQKMSSQEMVVVMNQDYSPEELLEYGDDYALSVEKGQVIKVMKNGDEYDYYGSSRGGTFLKIPSDMFHVLGTVKGEKYLLVKSSNMRLLKEPSDDSDIYCYDDNAASSYLCLDFVHTLGPVVQAGNAMDWKLYTFPKGCRLPYLGKENGFFKTQVDGQEFYVSKKYCKLK